MIYERLALNFSVDQLVAQMEKTIFPLQPFMQTETFGGWSVLSSNGSYKDGWAQGHHCYEHKNQNVVFDYKKMQEMKLLTSQDYSKPTEICTGYFASVIEAIEQLGMTPRRARITMLKSGGQSALHRDGLPGHYAVRLHIPIITNPGCLFECEDGSAHFPADGSGYFIFVNRMHQIFNHGKSDRYHLIMDVWDHKHVTRSHHFRPITMNRENLNPLA